MQILELQCPILEQLQIEEALLRADQGNWCILNTGTDPAIVFGISGKPQLHLDPLHYRDTPLIRRFSGGGTVLTDQNTLFVTWICNVKDIQVNCCPAKILAWTEEFYRPIFNHAHFKARENDYVFAEKKIGGNAQYLCRDRWLHHTSFLWSYDPQAMRMLALPPKQPTYRQNRSHDDFLAPLKNHFPQKNDLFDRIKQKLGCPVVQIEDVASHLHRPHRKATTRIMY